MKAYEIEVRGTYKTTEKKLKAFNYKFIVPHPIIGTAKYFVNRLVIAKMKMEELIDFDYIYKIYVIGTKPVEYNGELFGKTIHSLTEYQVQEFAIMHSLRAVPYFQREDIDEIKKRAVIEYAKTLKPEIATKIEEEFIEMHISQLPKIKISEPVIKKAIETTETSALDMFDDMVVTAKEAPEMEVDKVDEDLLFEEVEQESVEASETSDSGMTKEELIDALKGLGVGNIHPNTSIEKLEKKYKETLKNLS